MVKKPPRGEAFIFAIIFLITTLGGIGVKKGFSLVELLIVLAVIAALVSSITIFAMNTIKKAKATQIAQNLKIVADSVENKLYLEGLDHLSEVSDLSYYGKNISGSYKLYLLTKPDGEIIVNTVYNALDVDSELLEEILPDATTTSVDIHHELQAGEEFYRITSYVLKSIATGVKVTIVPKDSIYLSKTIRLF